MLIEKYDEKPQFEIGFSPFYFISYPLYNIQCRSILYKYLNYYDERVRYNSFINLNNLNLKTYIIHIFNSLHQIYSDEGLKGLYKGVVPMLAHIVSKKSIYYLLEKLHFVIFKKIRNKKKRDIYDKKIISNYEKRFLNKKENTNNYIGDNDNYKIIRHINFVKEENNYIKKKKKKKFFHLSFYHSFYEYVSCILSYPLLNISTKLIIFQNNSKSLIYNLKNIIRLTFKYDGFYGFFKGINNYLIIQSMDKVLNCFLYFMLSSTCSYDKVLTIKVVLSTCLNTIMAPYIQYSILNRSQSYIPGLCKNTTFSQFFNHIHWKSHLSNVYVGLGVAGVQLMIIALLPKDTHKNDEIIDKEKDEYF